MKSERLILDLNPRHPRLYIFFCICFAVLGRKRPRVEPALCLQNKENPANVSQLKTAIHIHFVGKAKEKRSDLVALGLMQHCFSIFGF